MRIPQTGQTPLDVTMKMLRNQGAPVESVSVGGVQSLATAMVGVGYGPGESKVSDHNSLGGKQGGSEPDEFYHMGLLFHNALADLFDGGVATGSGAGIAAVYAQTVRTGLTAGSTTLLQAYDVDGATWKTLATLTANNTPTLDFDTAVTVGGQYIYRVGGTDVSLVDGGTGASLTAALGSVPYSGASALALLAGNVTTTRKFLLSVGDGGAAAAPSWDAVTKTDVGLANVTNDAQVKLASYTAAGDILYGTGAGAVATLAGAAGWLKSTGAAAPAWTAIAQADVSGLTTTSSPRFGGLTVYPVNAASTASITVSSNAYVPQLSLTQAGSIGWSIALTGTTGHMTLGTSSQVAITIVRSGINIASIEITNGTFTVNNTLSRGANAITGIGDLGASETYVGKAYITKHYLSATAAFDGANAGRIGITGTLDSFTMTAGSTLTGVSLSASANIGIAATGKLLLDTLAGHTYFYEKSNDVVALVLGGAEWGTFSIVGGKSRITFG